MVRDLDIARWRLRSQHVVSPFAASARAAVGSLLAVQAENSSQAAWAAATQHPRPRRARYRPGGRRRRAGTDGHLLQILDETYRGYQDSRWVLDTAGDVPRTRETATGMALVDAQLLASMRRTIGNDHVRFDLEPYRTMTTPEIEALEQAANRYGRYLGLEARLAVR